MTSEIVAVANSDMAKFSDEEIKRAGELLGVPLDRGSALRALIIQRDTGLSITRGEISILSMGGKPTVFVNKQGYLAYAARQPEYDGYEFGIETRGEDLYAWCKVYRKDRSRPTYEDAWLSEDKQPSSPTWAKMPKRMLAKVAIKRAHQAAFPVLNGTYEPAEAWDDSVRIEQRDDDIVVKPYPPEENPKQPTSVPKPKVIETYSLEQAQMILENYGANGFDTAVFERARISDSEFDKEMINADFKRQNEAIKAAKKAESKLVQPQHPEATGTIVSNEVCSVCGKRLLTKDVEDSRKYGKLLCPNCQIDELKARAAAKEATTQSKIEPEFVCTICGKPITKVRKDICEYYQVPVMCTECQKAQEEQHE
ncbi:MAG TPA: recombinase RecT [Methanocorpusculum sp.]|nr:recombinase RecT [Methanocorpusculum sp.]